MAKKESHDYSSGPEDATMDSSDIATLLNVMQNFQQQ